MKKIIMIMTLCSIFGTVVAQKNVSNIRVQQHDTLLFVTYDLAVKANIDVYISFDNGTTFRGPLKSVSGAIGKGIMPEKDKMFVWDVVKDVGYIDNPNTVIKIVSSGEKALPVLGEEPAVVQYMPFSLGIEGGIAPSIVNDLTHFDIGARITQNLRPRLGFDIVKLKGSFSAFPSDDRYYHTTSLNTIQLLTGARIATPYFGKEKSLHVYTSLRIGPGYYWERYKSSYYESQSYSDASYFTFCLEWDTGLHFKHFFVGTSLSYIIEELSIGLRVGIDIGKMKSY